MRYSILLVGILVSTSAMPDNFKSPTGKSSLTQDQVNSPFGQYGHNGHIHSGWDMQNHGYNYAATSGMLYICPERSKQNVLCLEPDDNSKIKVIKYRHSISTSILFGLAGSYGTGKKVHVNAGDKISSTGAKGEGPPHTHFEVIAKEGTFTSRAIINMGGTVGRSPLMSGVFSGQKITPFAVEPYPFFNVPSKLLGRGTSPYKNTKDMYEKLYPNGDVFSTESIQGANNNAIANEMGVDNPSEEQIAQFLFEHGESSYGGTVESFIANEDQSFEERLGNIANYRFTSEAWAKSITSATSRALYADYVAADGLEIFLKNEIQKRRNHIEALLATYASQKIKESKKQAMYAFENATQTNITNSIK